MRLLEARSHRAMPWKNGGGTTYEIARAPEDAAMEDFAWRVSMARVESAGPFSRFDGVDRTIAVVEGGPMALAIAGRDVALARGGGPFAFPGEAPVVARVPGATLDLNVMTRRGRFRHFVARIEPGATTLLEPLGDVWLLFVADGACDAARGDEGASLGPRDTLLVDDGARDAVRIEPRPRAELFVVDFWRV
jgi:environmental stress-induced protein Ves